MRSRYSIQVLERTAEILECFTNGEPQKSLLEISRETGLNKSTVFRILDTLDSLGWVARSSKDGSYRLGLAIFKLGNWAIKGLDFYDVSHPHLEHLAKITGQTVHLGIHDNGKILYLNKLENPGTIISQPSAIGYRLPMHCTAMGKVLLAFSDNEETLNNIIEKGKLKKFTKNTITKKNILIEELEDIRNKGYAIDNEEVQTGLCCIAAPIRDYTGRVIAAISVSGLKPVFNARRISSLASNVVKSAQYISRDLGH